MKNNPILLVKNFFKLEAASGIILLLAAIAAMIMANTPLQQYYDLLLDTPVEIRIGNFEIAKPLLLWINDGLMAIFFFLVGLELKREMMEGELSEVKKVVLPGVGAVGGMLVPALIYYYFNRQDPIAVQGWAIPTATDIAFALGILALVGSKVPTSVKIFLTSLAIFDDFGAIIIIAVFYTASISAISLAVTLICIALLYWINRINPDNKSLYFLVGIVMWVSLLKSGVHATLAGVILALFIPLKARDDKISSPLKSIESDLHNVVAFAILPLFAFANAGLSLKNVGMDQVLHSVPLGIAFGLFFGKQIGVFAFCWLAIKLHWAKLPSNVSWLTLYGVSILCGIGFTMSLFIGSLAFEESKASFLFDDRLGILLASLLSGLCGYLVLRRSISRSAKSSSTREQANIG